jgi:hypothetical protein
LPLEEVAERAARLGITLDRVLQALAWIAFGDITRVVSWDTETLTMTASGDLDDADKAAVAEIIASAKDQKIYRVKMHDKPSALALLLRWLDKLEKLKGEASNGEQDDDDGEDPREFLIRELTRIRARRAGNSGALPTTAEAESAEAPVPMGVSGAS